MSMKGQNTKSIRKKSLPNTRLPVVGTKSIVFFHQAISGEQFIDLTSLAIPSGHINPSPSEILKARIKDFETNFELMSSVKGKLMKPLSYEVVTNSTIKLKFEADDGEIFEGKLSNYTVNGTVIADVRTPQGSGEILEGQTDFNLGEAVPIENFSSQWPMQVFRGFDGRPMLRNANNAPYTGDDSIGNYQMVDRGDGYCQVIRFNIAGDVGNEPVMWASHGALGERPDLSTLQQVDKIHGIMDRMREDLLVVTGNDVEDPTRYDGGVPTQGDLKAFGDLIAKMLNVEIQTPNGDTNTKTLSATVNTVGDIPDLQFTGLEIGARYKVNGVAYHAVANSTTVLDFNSGPSGTGTKHGGSALSNSAGITISTGISFEFTAESETLYAYSAVAGGLLLGNGTTQRTFVQLTKLGVKKKIKDLI